MNADTRGVKGREILYIGRATSLRNRVRSYFTGRLLDARGPWIAKMLAEATSIDFRKTDSVLEAILLEVDLIKKFQPPYNAREKDDKSFNCIAITDEDFPRVALVRQHDIASGKLKTLNLQLKTVFGPFPHGLKLKEAMKIIRRIFPWRDSCTPCARAEEAQNERRRSQKVELQIPRDSAYRLQVSAVCKPCFNRQIGLCPGVCTGEISASEYRAHIRRLEFFLSGKKVKILRELEREMKRAAKSEQFEKAAEYKRQLFALKHIQDVALLQRDADGRRFESADKRGYTSQSASIRGSSSEHPRFRVEAYDLSHFGGKEIVGAMAVILDGVAVPSEYRLFKIRGLRGANEPAGMEEIIRRRFNHPEWPFPSLIVVDGGEMQKRAAERAVASAGKLIPVVAVVKDEKHRPREIIGLKVSERRGEQRMLKIKPARRGLGVGGDKGLGIRHGDILLAASEAHRFALKFQRKRRSKDFGLDMP